MGDWNGEPGVPAWGMLDPVLGVVRIDPRNARCINARMGEGGWPEVWDREQMDWRPATHAELLVSLLAIVAEQQKRLNQIQGRG